MRKLRPHEVEDLPIVWPWAGDSARIGSRLWSPRTSRLLTLNKEARLGDDWNNEWMWPLSEEGLSEKHSLKQASYFAATISEHLLSRTKASFKHHVI